MQNIIELRKDLAQNYTQIKNGKMTIAKGKELANTAGKILQSCKVQLDYNAFMGVKEKIEFLEK
jgi:hypothetical protein